jgi:hypothetical protein
MSGRDPYCLRCHTVGHTNRECKTPFCNKCFKMGHAPADCAGPTLADKVRWGPATGEIRQEYNDPEAQHPEESVPLLITVNNEVDKPEFNIVIDHFDGQVLKAAQSVQDESTPLIDLTELDKQIPRGVVNIIPAAVTNVQREIADSDNALITVLVPANLDSGLKQTDTTSVSCEQVTITTHPDCVSNASNPTIVNVSVEPIEKLAGATFT